MSKNPHLSKYFMPIAPSSRDTWIHREAREPAARALQALRELREADPWVFAAVIDVAGWEAQLAGRAAMRAVRRIAHEGKVAAMLEVCRRARTEVSEDEAPKDTERHRQIKNVVDLVGEYRAAGVELWATMEKIFEVLDWDAVDLLSLDLAIRMLLQTVPASTVEQVSQVADSEREVLAEIRGYDRAVSR